MRRYMHTKSQRALTLTELLVVMVIIGLLSSVAVPVYVNRMEEARVKIAQAEAREIAQAEEQCALIHGFYVPFQLLDDRPQIKGFTATGDTITREFNQICLVNPLIRPEIQQGNQVTLGDGISGNSSRARNLIEHWSGPFLTPKRVYTGTEDPKQPGFENTTAALLDFPLDPWGQPYRFYSPIGIIGSNATTTNMDNMQIGFSDGRLTQTDDRDLERYAVISYGQDNLPESTLGNNRDDIIHLFGTAGVESDFALRN